MKLLLESGPLAGETALMDLQDLAYQFRQRPFLVNRMAQPGEAFLDVDTIHQQEFSALIGAARDSLESGAATGLVLWGVPGIGKSHLLARLAKWAKEGNAWCIFLQNILASPARIPGYLVKCVVSQLTAGQRDHFRATPLYEMIATMIRRLAVGERKLAMPAFRLFAERVTTTFPEHETIDWEILKALWAFFSSAYDSSHKPADDRKARLAVRWLTGDRLEADDLRAIDLNASPGDVDAEEGNENRSLRVLAVLSELAREGGKPFILCLDQVDVLTDDRISALATFLLYLINSCRNLLTVYCGVQELLLDRVKRNVIPAAVWDRIKNGEAIQLSGLDAEGARKILQRRMENFIEPLLKSPAIKGCVEDDGLFPLGSEWLAQRLADEPDPQPRKAIRWAHQRWLEQERRLSELGTQRWLAQWQGSNGFRSKPPVASVPVAVDDLIDRRVKERIEEHCSRVDIDQSKLPPDASQLLGLMDALLAQLSTSVDSGIVEIASPPPLKKNCKPVYDRIVHWKAADERPPQRVGIVVICTGDRSSMARALRRLVDDQTPPDRVLIVVDKRRPLSLAAAGRKYHDTLFAPAKCGRYALRELSLPDVAQLDALQKVVNDARSGDLDVELSDGTSRTVTEAEVIASNLRTRRYAEHTLVQSVFLVNRPDTTHLPEEEIAADPFDDGDLRQFILAQLALTMGMTASGLAARYGEERNVPEETRAALKESIVSVAKQMHKEKRLHATPCDDDLSLLL